LPRRSCWRVGSSPETEEGPGTLVSWLQAGFWIGVAGLSKYHSILFVAGLLMFLASVPLRRRILGDSAPWLGALFALVITAPVLVWNIQHDWISVGFQAGRSRAGSGLHIELDQPRFH
jgi:4-amino-4-deoxy-L-arabinose transferase-like glycosyltransferase